jgi:hypothetical protein
MVIRREGDVDALSLCQRGCPFICTVFSNVNRKLVQYFTNAAFQCWACLLLIVTCCLFQISQPNFGYRYKKCFQQRSRSQVASSYSSSSSPPPPPPPPASPSCPCYAVLHIHTPPSPSSLVCQVTSVLAQQLPLLLPSHTSSRSSRRSCAGIAVRINPKGGLISAALKIKHKL